MGEISHKKSTKKSHYDLFYILYTDISQCTSKEESGEKFNINKVNLAELERRTGISRRKLRRLKANKFVVKPHGLSGRTSNNNVTEAFSGVLDDLFLKV